MRLRNGPFCGSHAASVCLRRGVAHARRRLCQAVGRRGQRHRLACYALDREPACRNPRAWTGTAVSRLRSQNGRGGLFSVVQNADLASGISALIGGDSDPTE